MKRVLTASAIVALLFSQLLLTGNSANADQVGSLNRFVGFADSNVAFDGGLIQVSTGSASDPCDGGFTNPKCAIATNNLTTTNTLAPCDSKISTPCIEEVFAQNEKSDWVKGVTAGQRTPPWSFYAFPAKPEFELGAANRNNLFTFAGIGDPVNNLFEINPIMIRQIKKGVLQDPLQLSMAIHAVYEGKNEPEPGKFRWDAKTGADVVKEDGRCIDSIAFTTKCWKYGSNPLTNKFKVVLRLPSAPSGWLSGRLLNPDVIFEKLSGSPSQPFRLTIAGSPVPTPTLSKQYFYDVPAEKADWEKVSKVFNLPWSIKMSISPALGPINIDEFTAAVKADSGLDTATTIVDKWLVNMSWAKTYEGQLGNCPNTGFLGYVGSNSLTYGSELPTYDATTGSLVYRVASPHFMPAGQEFTGIYAMVLNREYANCIWKLSGAAISASVEVLSEDGKPKIATASAKFNETTINFLATGFTFSSPTLRVKLVQENVVKPVENVVKPVENPAMTQSESKNENKVATPAIAPKKIKAINCVKGKLTRKISGVNPKCPAGYVKK
ncbi:MAG: hypothetical protein F2657_02470 [Actinobacteria bacterium]|uniref:Unannotated protein n=1 Tax=freshwater metagenome TaxID=449393 RepID=A0A6J6VVH2_9ZZZZ|nr:hypothetical protein [Actinomycetota bacterium]MSY04972.1 hypothetical protein [Actinomycetota bacterium]MSY67176.1 hypothetical protein [Actinomycetota bacterium]MTA00913.1 hypothetical protein [Actinomycetota bacterium]